MSKTRRLTRSAKPKPTEPPKLPNYPAKQLSPILPVADLQITSEFYRRVFGFEAPRQSSGYAVLRRGTTSIHLSKAEPGVLKKTRGQFAIYLEVEDIEALWAYVSSFRDTYQIRDLFDREYGMREFHIIDPDGCLIFVGQAVRT
jgi:predicted enzyme related to lactoylglutathione lyase